MDNHAFTADFMFKSFIVAHSNAHPYNEHHHTSFEKLIGNSGLSNIITSQFKISNTLTNNRKETEEDKKISTISYNVSFSNVIIKTPIITVNNKPEILTPNQAVNQGLTYFSPVFVTVKMNAIAYDHHGNIYAEVNKELPNFEIASIPIMVKSEKCNTYNCSRQEMYKIREDPSDKGGYFIIKGKEVSLTNLESVQYNYIRLTKHEIAFKGELARGVIISKPGDSFENSFQLTVKYIQDGSIMLVITSTYFKDMQIPFYIIYRILGITTDEDIINTIVFDMHNKDELTQKLVSILSYAIVQAPPGKKFETIYTSKSSQELAQFIANDLTPLRAKQEIQTYKKNKGNQTKTITTDVTNVNSQRFNITVLYDKLDKTLLPHMGQNVEDRINKLRYLGYLIQQVLLVQLDVIKSTDQNSYFTNRIDTPGITYSKTFKTAFNKVIISPVNNKLKQLFTTSAFRSVQMENAFITTVKQTELLKAMTQSINNGKDVISKSTGQKIANRIRATPLEHKNDLFDKNTYLLIDKNSAVEMHGTNQKMMERKGVHASYLGYVCLVQSADTGEKVGRNKSMTIMARITTGSYSQTLIKTLLDDEDIIDITNVRDQDMITMSRIFVNGRIIGVTSLNVFDVAAKYRDMRRKHLIHFETTIFVDILTTDLRFFTDAGRLIRPLLIVAPGPSPNDLVYTAEHARQLVSGEIDIFDLEKMGVFEYIAPDEQDNLMIAQNYETLRRNTSELIKYTHCEIEQAIYGLVALTSPFSNRTQPQRITIMTNQAKQACGWPLLNWQFRSPRKFYMQTYCEMPTVKTITNDFTNPNGANVIVAYMSYRCMNQEDCSVINKSSAERGKFGVMNHTNVKLVFEKNYINKSPIENNVTPKMNVNYSKLVDGNVRINDIITHNDALIGCIEGISKDYNTIKYVDHSEVYKGTETMQVIDVIKTINEDGKLFVKVALVSYRPLNIGSKISSRHGNKSIVGSCIPEIDLPFTRSGIVPDLIITPHGIPKRMIFSQLIETAMAKLCVAKGSVTDATTFTHIDLNQLNDELKKFGINYMGYEPIIDGVTGEEYYAMICVGPIYYMRLQKFSVDTIHSIARGQTDAVTRQPIKGRHVEGGLRLGEMEKDALSAHGAMTVLYEKFVKHSDEFDRYMCRRCGGQAVYNPRKLQQPLWCPICNNNCDIVRLNSTWMSNIIHHSLEASHIDVKYNMSKLNFYE